MHDYCAPEHLSWNYRWPLIASELERYDADLYCLQEVESGMYQHQLQPWMQQHGYGSLFYLDQPAPADSQHQQKR